jgi:hypothetical protein
VELVLLQPRRRTRSVAVDHASGAQPGLSITTAIGGATSKSFSVAGQSSTRMAAENCSTRAAQTLGDAFRESWRSRSLPPQRGGSVAATWAEEGRGDPA